ncbi:phosphoribosylformylglycinamidine cyclo-ligase [Desulfovibrio sp. JC022]|uniref:phosphoribosylformylglycinamidine cyclo-ligase n=1 Tax=Desulfovibrio sp. JC022 TaxID=2593642 RepID=UPI0013D37911|nr:phosphoribosylformylglycinamidine cyclo-ligase [Desulfovibrio sp. JC022]NDV22913.1 phosphoribosylformylglycinamidine cyclo-ligase [Desulfovibrio sp. JC022]
MASRSDAYKAAGVDIDAANDFIGRIKGMVGSTFTKGVVTDIGGFGGLFKLDLTQMEEPVLVAGADGVGTKLKLAFAVDKHDTIGIDLVAMSVNDILVQGAKPLFFLDYFATGKLESGVAEEVIAGVVEGCKQSGCALLGGETAEMPGFYADGEYDLSGFCVGMVDNTKIVDGSSITIGDSIIGLESSGIHSNGYSLVRKIFDESGLKADDLLPGTDRKIGEALLAPTRIYVDAVHNLSRDIEIKGMVHVTGGGFYDNVPRILPKQVTAEINFNSWEVSPVFNWLKEQGDLSWPEMLQIFNTGIGYILVVAKDREEDVLNRLAGMKINSWKIGEITRRDGDSEQVKVNF